MMRSFVIALALTALACGGDGDAEGPKGSATAAASGAGSGGGSTTAGSGSTGSTTGSTGSGGGGGGPGRCSGKTGALGDADLTLPWNGSDRSFHVHTPPGYDGTQAAPLVFVFHGWLGSSGGIEADSKMTPETDAVGAIVVYPQGLSNSWNAGTCCGTSASSGEDDVGFVGAMLDALEDAYCVDDHRVFSSGFSNGGMLSHRLACELEDRIAAIGPVSGTIAIPDCAPSRPVPVMHFHGTSDPIVSYSSSLGNAQSVPDTISGWVARNGCPNPPVSTFAQGDAHCESYEGCTADATVTLCTLEGGGHQWPSGTGVGIGTVNMDISASKAMLEFFAVHPMP